MAETEDLDGSAAFYEEHYFDPNFLERRRKCAQEQAAWLLGNFQPGMTILEIGPGFGFAAEALLGLVPEGTRYHMIEPQPAFRDFIRRHLGDRVQIHSEAQPESISALIAREAEPGKPWLVYLDNVLEHLPEPAGFLALVRDHLPAGSRILVDVPNERGLKWRSRIYRGLGATPTTTPVHINLFTKQSVKAMARHLGLPVEVRQRGMRRPEEVSCLPHGPALDAVLGLLRVVPVDVLMGLANHLRFVLRVPTNRVS